MMGRNRSVDVDYFFIKVQFLFPTSVTENIQAGVLQTPSWYNEHFLPFLTDDL